jgi:hypothetical protein
MQTGWTDQKQQMHVDFLDSSSPDEEIDDDDKSNASQILEAKHQKVDGKEVAEQQTHLTSTQ